MKITSTVVCFLFAVAAMAFPPNEKYVKAWLEVTPDGEMTMITGKLVNSTTAPMTLSYDLVMEKKGKSGSTSNSSGGEFVADPGQEVDLAVTSVNIEKGDYVSILLKVYNEKGELVAEDRFEGIKGKDQKAGKKR